MNLLGDLNRTGRREVRLNALVAAGEEIGVSAPTMRLTLAPLRECSRFHVRRAGRESVYPPTLAGARPGRGRTRIFYAPVGPWPRE